MDKKIVMFNVFEEWLTKEGEVLKICNMRTSHIQNCIKLIDERKEKDGWRESCRQPLVKELKRRKLNVIEKL